MHFHSDTDAKPGNEYAYQSCERYKTKCIHLFLKSKSWKFHQAYEKTNRNGQHYSFQIARKVPAYTQPDIPDQIVFCKQRTKSIKYFQRMRKDGGVHDGCSA